MLRFRHHCRPAARPWASELARASRLRPELPATRCSLPATSSGLVRRSLGEGGFTIVEVMMASVILVVGFIGMIQAITVGSEMMATARRQNLAAQIINHELEKLRLISFTTIDGYAAGPTAVTIDSQFSDAITASGLTTDTSNSANPYIQLERSVADVVSGNMCQVTFTVTWQKSGTTAAANTVSGSWLEKLSLGGNAPIRRTYVRKGFGFYGKYGLNLNAQRS